MSVFSIEKFEKDCIDNHINQYYLIRAKNDLADSFYNKFSNATLDEEPLLRKEL